MNLTETIALYNQDQRINVTYDDIEREVTPTIVRHVDRSSRGEGSVIYSQLNTSNADAEIREQVDYFTSIGQNFEWKLYDFDEPADLKDRLAAFGFTVEEAEAIMVLDLTAAPASLWQPAPQVERITDPARLVDVQRVKEQVWEGDAAWVQSVLGDTLRNHPDQVSIYIAYVDGEPASAAWSFFPVGSQFTSLWGGSTVSKFRNRGLYTALLATRAQEAHARGRKFLTVDASPMSRPILEKLGFECIAHSYPCKWMCVP